MIDKPLNYRQSLFVKYYTGDNGTKGNATASALKAGYKWKYANTASEYLLGNTRIKAAIEAEGLKIEAEDVNSREFVTKEYLSQYMKRKDTTLAHPYLQDLAKNCGWFAQDNAQRTEQANLDKTEVVELQRIANILNFESAKAGKAG